MDIAAELQQGLSSLRDQLEDEPQLETCIRQCEEILQKGMEEKEQFLSERKDLEKTVQELKQNLTTYSCRAIGIRSVTNFHVPHNSKMTVAKKDAATGRPQSSVAHGLPWPKIWCYSQWLQRHLSLNKGTVQNS